MMYLTKQRFDINIKVNRDCAFCKMGLACTVRTSMTPRSALVLFLSSIKIQKKLVPMKTSWVGF